MLTPDRDPDQLVQVVDVPVTLSGLSAHNTANALAAAPPPWGWACRARPSSRA